MSGKCDTPIAHHPSHHITGSHKGLSITEMRCLVHNSGKSRSCFDILVYASPYRLRFRRSPDNSISNRHHHPAILSVLIPSPVIYGPTVSICARLQSRWYPLRVSCTSFPTIIRLRIDSLSWALVIESCTFKGTVPLRAVRRLAKRSRSQAGKYSDYVVMVILEWHWCSIR